MKDIGIATFLMLLWKQMFKADARSVSIGSNTPPPWDGIRKSCDPGDGNALPPWFDWPRPPSGFIDLGCVCATEDAFFGY